MDPRSARNADTTPRWILTLQILSVSWIWLFVLGISIWILRLLREAIRWHDVPTASVAISVVAIPVFLTGAAVLTYVFAGLRRGARQDAGETGHETRGES